MTPTAPTPSRAAGTVASLPKSRGAEGPDDFANALDGEGGPRGENRSTTGTGEAGEPARPSGANPRAAERTLRRIAGGDARTWVDGPGAAVTDGDTAKVSEANDPAAVATETGDAAATPTRAVDGVAPPITTAASGPADGSKGAAAPWPDETGIRPAARRVGPSANVVAATASHSTTTPDRSTDGVAISVARGSDGVLDDRAAHSAPRHAGTISGLPEAQFAQRVGSGAVSPDIGAPVQGPGTSTGIGWSGETALRDVIARHALVGPAPSPVAPDIPVDASVRTATQAPATAIRLIAGLPPTPPSEPIILHLRPAELGAVEVEIARRAGGLAVELRVETPDALRAMDAERGALEEMLRRDGGREGANQASVSIGLRDGRDADRAQPDEAERGEGAEPRATDTEPDRTTRTI